MAAKLYIFLLCLCLTGCESKIKVKKVDKKIDLNSIFIESIAKLQTKKILFGHKSIGKNIIDGLKDIVANNKQFKNLNVDEFIKLDTPGIYHIQNGRNQFPQNKCDEFKKLLKKENLGNQLDIAFFKFCFIDFKENSDVQNIFEYYNQTIEELEKEFPNLRLIHVTTPLTIHPMGGLKGFIKNRLKGDIRNIKRNQFNQLIRDKYKNIFDLATIESLYPSGKRETFKEGGTTYFSLVKEYSNDGGHLNEVGRFYAAKELLLVLSKVASTK